MPDWRATSDFVAIYDQLDDETVAHVDTLIRRVVREPDSVWARQGRVVGTHRSAWIVESRLGDSTIALYWTLDQSRGPVILLLLIIR